jgi:hypothetical protein
MNPITQMNTDMEARNAVESVEELAGYLDKIADALGITSRGPFVIQFNDCLDAIRDMKETTTRGKK